MIGVVVMLVLSTGLFWLVRRRGADDADTDDAHPEHAHQSEA